ncbi:MAG: response regulator transcription factor [Planctomycetes bacterium]|nr:response regulator transcription factor [Planctomycetota bacterium]
MTRFCLVVEDESPLGEMLCDNLHAEGYRAELVRDGVAALQRLALGGIDLVLLDIMLPEADGFEVLRRMRERGDRTPVLVLSARSADRDRIRGLELEADDYLTKPFNLRELLLRVAALLRRTPAPPPGTDVLQVGRCRVDFRSHEVVCERGEHRHLSDSELKLLRLLSGRAGEVVSRREILDHVFGKSANPSTRTLDNLVLGLRRTLEDDTRQPRHLHTVRGVGLKLILDASAGDPASAQDDLPTEPGLDAGAPPREP